MAKLHLTQYGDLAVAGGRSIIACRACRGRGFVDDGDIVCLACNRCLASATKIMSQPEGQDSPSQKGGRASRSVRRLPAGPRPHHHADLTQDQVRPGRDDGSCRGGAEADDRDGAMAPRSPTAVVGPEWVDPVGHGPEVLSLGGVAE